MIRCLLSKAVAEMFPVLPIPTRASVFSVTSVASPSGKPPAEDAVAFSTWP